MGSTSIKVATLNYSGVNYSPFEFYSTDKQETKILQIMGNIFHQLIEIEFKQQLTKIIPKAESKPDYTILSNIESKPYLFKKFDWKIGAIDKFTQRERYTPIYNKQVGVSKGKLMTREEFENNWDIKFQKSAMPVLTKKNKIPTEEEIIRCKKLDYLLFKTFVEYVYWQNEQKDEQFHPILEDRKEDSNICSRYQELMSSFFNKQYLRDNIKIVTMITNLMENDVVFFQDLNPVDYKTLEKSTSSKFDIKYNQISCAILIKKKAFDEILSFQEGVKKYKLQEKEEMKACNFNYYRHQPSLVLFAEKQGYIFLLLSTHLSSGAMNEVQVQDFMYHMVRLTQIFRKHQKKINIIVGGDFNQYIGTFAEKNPDFKQNFKFYPLDEESQPTTNKKRTKIHAQMKKSQIIDRKCRDFIVTPLQIVSGIIKTANGKKIENDILLPCDDQPFDHYMVHATLKFGGMF